MPWELDAAGHNLPTYTSHNNFTLPNFDVLAESLFIGITALLFYLCPLGKNNLSAAPLLMSLTNSWHV